MGKKIIKEQLNEGFATEEGRKLDEIANLLEYDDFHEFIGDNPGCYSAITEWIDEIFGEQLGYEYLEPESLENLNLHRAADITRDMRSEEDNI